MPAKTPKRHCNIMAWLGQEHPDLHQAIQTCCLERSLGTRETGPGMTFLVPTEEVRNTIIKHAYLDTMPKAIELIEAHTIPMNMASAADFKKKIGSRARVLLRTDKINGATSATLPGGAVVKKDDTFKPVAKNLSIWVVEKGEVPTSGEDFDPKTVRKIAVASIEGGGDAPGHTKASINDSLWKSFVVAWQAGNRQGARRVYHEAVLGLLTYVHQRDRVLYSALLAILDRDPIVSWKLASDLTPDSIFQEWGGVRAQGCVEAHLHKFFQNPAAAAPEGDRSAAIYANPLGVERAAREVAGRVLEADCRPPQSHGDIIWQVYADALKSNSIGSVPKVWPEGVAETLASRKAWQDLLRVNVKLLFASGDWSNLCTELHALLFETLPGRDHAAEFTAFACPKNEIAPGDKQAMALLVPSTTDFFYFPKSSSHVADIGAGGDINYPPGTQETHNSDALPQAELEVATSAPTTVPW